MRSQSTREYFYFKVPVFILDLCIHLSILGLLLNYMSPAALVGLPVDNVSLYALLGFSFILGIYVTPLRLHERTMRIRYVLWRAVKQTAMTYLVFTLLVIFAFKATPRFLLFVSASVAMVCITLEHYLAIRLVRYSRLSGKNVRNVVIVGADVTAKRVYEQMVNGRLYWGYKVAGFFTSLGEESIPEGSKLLGTIDDIAPWFEKNSADAVCCSLPPAKCQKEVNQLIKICNDKLIDFYFVPTFDGYPKRHLHVTRLGNVNVIRLREEPMDTPLAKVFKRGSDILISGLFLCTLYPFVLLFVWIGNKVTGNVGPLYFKQARTGYNGKSFGIYKFRSMKVNADADKLQATENDPRKTPFGDFLRRSSIDELPQFINVFKGDMSVIGPRPHMEYHTEVYSELIDTYMVRHLSKPGITGWAQVNGCRGETKTVEDMERRVQNDIWYIEHWSPLLDVEIFFKTIWQVMPGHDKQAY